MVRRRDRFVFYKPSLRQKPQPCSLPSIRLSYLDRSNFSQIFGVNVSALIAEVTEILSSLSEGDSAGKQRLWELLYPELHKIAQAHLGKERAGHTLQPTALVNEAFLKLADQDRVQWKGRGHFLVVASEVMRRILVDHARHRLREKRGGGAKQVELTEDMLSKLGEPEDVVAVDEALKKLKELDERQARIVELRFFGGLTVPEVAEVLGLSTRLIESEWQMIRAWLKRELTRK